MFGYILQKLSQHDARSNIELKSQNIDVQVFNISTKKLPALDAGEPKYKIFFFGIKPTPGQPHEDKFAYDSPPPLR